ncbi:MAG TPA: hypothetical protein VMB91_05045 [Solirubrobacteraceae bacterium]|nr:hypothetical protein [Solirubrobacteraceae bacterium]
MHWPSPKHKPLRRLAAALASALVGLAVAAVPNALAVLPAPTAVEYPIPTASSEPTGITAGPEGEVWFTERKADAIASITQAGTVKEFPIPTPNAEPDQITAGADGNLWFTEPALNAIGRMTPGGEFASFPVPTPASQPTGITTGPGGNVWFTEKASSAIGEITPAGSISEHATLFGSDGPVALAPGRDNAIWYAGSAGNHVGYVNETNGAEGETTMGTASSEPDVIAEGPEGAEWIGMKAFSKVARYNNLFSSPGVEYETFGAVTALIEGPGQMLWLVTNSFLEEFSPVLGQEINLYQLASTPGQLVEGPEYDIWATEPGADKIARVVTNAKPGPEGREGAVGKEGPAGREGAAGREGPQGKQGSTGLKGTAGKVLLVTCKFVKKGSHRKRVCKTKSVTGSATFVTGAKAAAVLSRRGVVYATGAELAGHGDGDIELVISAQRRRLVAGSYELTVRAKVHGRWHTTTREIAIGAAFVS